MKKGYQTPSYSLIVSSSFFLSFFQIGHDVSWWSDVIQVLELYNMDGQAVTSIRLILNEAQISGRNREGSSLAER